MTGRLKSVVLLSILFSSFAAVNQSSLAQEFPQTALQRLKHATALVLRGKSAPNTVRETFGTAICIASNGLFVAHIYSLPTGGWDRVRLVLNLGEPSEKVLSASVVLHNASSDLVLLHSSGAQGLPYLEPAELRDIGETQQIAVGGYTTVYDAAKRPDDAPPIRIFPGRILSLEKSAGEIQRIQTDVQAAGRAPGWPIVRTDGKLLGIVNNRGGSEYVTGAPAAVLTSLLSTPIILFNPESISALRSAQQQRITFQVVSRTEDIPSIGASFTLQYEDKTSRTYSAARQSGDTFAVTTSTGLPGPSLQHTPGARAIAYSIEVHRGVQKLTESGGNVPNAGTRNGTLIVGADEFPTSEISDQNGHPSPGKQFILNIGKLFARGRSGNFLVYSTHWTFGDKFRKTLTDAGHRVTVSMEPRTFYVYDGVFVGGDRISARSELADYIKRGGNVYLASGTGFFGEIEFWNPFLKQFCMSLYVDPKFNELAVDSFAPGPLFRGVTSLPVKGPYLIRLLPDGMSRVQPASVKNGAVFWAVFSTRPNGPESPVASNVRGHGYVRWPENGHWYCAVDMDSRITWEEARKQAEEIEFLGIHGHLVTVGSAQENAFIAAHFPGDTRKFYWLGGYQNRLAPDFSEPAGGWTWVTGEKWNYAAWDLGRPNNPGGHEDFLAQTQNGKWKDSEASDIHSFGYLVEFERK